MYVSMYVCMYVCTQPYSMSNIQYKVSFWVKFNKFAFKVFLLLDQLPYQD